MPPRKAKHGRYGESQDISSSPAPGSLQKEGIGSATKPRDTSSSSLPPVSIKKEEVEFPAEPDIEKSSPYRKAPFSSEDILVQPSPLALSPKPSLAKEKGQLETPWTQREEQKLEILVDSGISWGDIASNFPSRSESSIKNHLHKVMRYTEITEDQSNALVDAILEYEARKWKVIGQKLGKSAKACEQYAKEHFSEMKITKLELEDEEGLNRSIDETRNEQAAQEDRKQDLTRGGRSGVPVYLLYLTCTRLCTYIQKRTAAESQLNSRQRSILCRYLDSIRLLFDRHDVTNGALSQALAQRRTLHNALRAQLESLIKLLWKGPCGMSSSLNTFFRHPLRKLSVSDSSTLLVDNLPLGIVARCSFISGLGTKAPANPRTLVDDSDSDDDFDSKDYWPEFLENLSSRVDCLIELGSAVELPKTPNPVEFLTDF